MKDVSSRSFGNGRSRDIFRLLLVGVLRSTSFLSTFQNRRRSKNSLAASNFGILFKSFKVFHFIHEITLSVSKQTVSTNLKIQKCKNLTKTHFFQILTVFRLFSSSSDPKPPNLALFYLALLKRLIF